MKKIILIISCLIICNTFSMDEEPKFLTEDKEILAVLKETTKWEGRKDDDSPLEINFLEDELLIGILEQLKQSGCTVRAYPHCRISGQFEKGVPMVIRVYVKNPNNPDEPYKEYRRDKIGEPFMEIIDDLHTNPKYRQKS